MIQPRILFTSSRTVSILLAPNEQYALSYSLPWTLETDIGEAISAGSSSEAIVFIEGLRPNTSYVLRTDQASVDFRTAPCTGLVDCTDFGVDPNAKDNTQAFENAIAAVPAGGTLRVAGGRFETGPIFLRSNMTLLIEADAQIVAIADRTNWRQLPAHDQGGRALGTWEGLPEPCFAAVVTAIDCADLVITGSGKIDGGGNRGDWWEWPKETRDGARRPRSLHLAYCDGAAVSGITVCNSPSWTVHPYRCRNLHFSALSIENPADSPNTDGLNPESCVGVEICGVVFSVGDDCIAIKAGKRGEGDNTHLLPCSDINISHCLMQFGHGAVVLGSEMSGDIRNVLIERCSFRQTDRGLRLKTRRGRGGVIENIVMRDVDMIDVPTPLAVNAFYFCDADGKNEWVQSRKPAAVDATTPAIKKITISNVTALNVTLAAAALLGLPEVPVREVSIDNFTVSYAPNAKPDIPLMALNVAPVRHGGIIAEYADVTGQLNEIKS